MSFRKGDKVKVISGGGYDYNGNFVKGRIGRIIIPKDRENNYLIDFGEGFSGHAGEDDGTGTMWYVGSYNLELVKSKKGNADKYVQNR